MSTADELTAEGNDSNADQASVRRNYERVTLIIGLIQIVLCVLGGMGNALSVAVYVHPQMRSPINVLLTGLSVIDLLFCILAVPTFVAPAMYVWYKTEFFRLIMVYTAKFIYPLTLATQSASVWTFMIITFERWQAVCRPFYIRWSSVRRSQMSLLLICTLAFLYNFVRYFEFQLVYREPPTNSDKVDVDVASNLTTVVYEIDSEFLLRNNTAYMHFYYLGMFLVTHFTIPFCFLAFFNALIIRTIWESRRRRRSLNRKERSEHRTAIMMVIVLLIFAVCYSLMFILNIVESVNLSWFLSPSTMDMAYALNDFSNLLVVLNASSTIVIYCVFSQRYRQLLVVLLTRLPLCNVLIARIRRRRKRRTLATGATSEGDSDGYWPKTTTHCLQSTSKPGRSGINVLLLMATASMPDYRLSLMTKTTMIASLTPDEDEC